MKIAAETVALHAQTSRRRRGAWSFVRWRSVLVLRVEDLGPLGTFAEIDAGGLNRFGQRETEIVNARELLALDWLENLSNATAACVPLSKKRVAAAA